MSCRPGAYNRKIKTQNDLEFEKVSQHLTAITKPEKIEAPEEAIRTDQLESVQAKWSRKSKLDIATTPKGLPHKPIQKKLFDKRLDKLSLKTRNIEDYEKMLSNVEENEYRHAYYVAKFESHLLDLQDMASLAPGQEIYETVINVLLCLMNVEDKCNVVDTFTATKLFQLGIFEDIRQLDNATNHRIATTLAKILSQPRDTIVPICFAHHFYLAKIRVDGGKGTIELFDSLREKTSLRAADLLSRLTSQVNSIVDITGMNFPWAKTWRARDVACVQQTDCYNCGIYVLHFADKIFKGQTTYNQKFEPDLKRISFFKILQSEVNLQNVCYSCCGQIGENKKYFTCIKCPAAVDEICFRKQTSGQVHIDGKEYIQCPACAV
ncbi:hypothetical protein RP20_CCG006762 [Aedes albopictus]|nr:hypothetical protein RP20_CCG006762 [Aedes albopictus]